ncbi:unnamed protein product [Peniophora sp. CBMAI 1063]|nr:unnamed protein product [Peniophora sp. CBMAI 1063]
MAGHGHSAGYGFHPHLPGFKHKFLGKALGATMWFWIFYRARQDYPKLLGEHGFHDHGHDEHHGDGHH